MFHYNMKCTLFVTMLVLGLAFDFLWDSHSLHWLSNKKVGVFYTNLNINSNKANEKGQLSFQINLRVSLESC